MIDSIEKTLICTVLEYNHISADKEILLIELDSVYFENKFHKLIVNGINRLKELDEPLCADTLRQKMMDANKWSLQYDNLLLEIISHNAIATKQLFSSYYDFLKKHYIDKQKKEILQYI